MPDIHFRSVCFSMPSLTELGQVKGCVYAVYDDNLDERPLFVSSRWRNNISVDQWRSDVHDGWRHTALHEYLCSTGNREMRVEILEIGGFKRHRDLNARVYYWIEKTDPHFNGSRHYCEHGLVIARCKHCGGADVCEHNRDRNQCRSCGKGICKHGKRIATCKRCVGSQICIHYKQLHKCPTCKPENFIRVLCGCGGYYQCKRIAAHLATQKHKKYLIRNIQ